MKADQEGQGSGKRGEICLTCFYKTSPNDAPPPPSADICMPQNTFAQINSDVHTESIRRCSDFQPNPGSECGIGASVSNPGNAKRGEKKSKTKERKIKEVVYKSE